jgi:putative inorganic carbon (hco3(-)) transporter
VQRALLLLLIAVSYILYAGGPRWTELPLLIITAVTALVAPRRTFAFPREGRVLDYALIALLAAIAVQITPLPRAIVDVLSPHADDLRSTVQFRSDTATGWVRLSVNPTASQRSLAIAALGILTFWISRGVFSSGASTRNFCRTLAIVGAAAAVSALIFRMTSPGLVLGTLQPEARSANPFGAFVNRNHFAGWLLLIAAPVGGYLIAHLRIHPAYRRHFRLGLKHFLVSGALIIAMAEVIVVIVALATLSRSGAAGLGCAAIYGWIVGRDRLRIERGNLPLLAALAGMILLIAVVFVDIPGWMTRLEQGFDISGDRNRLTIWRESLPMLRDFWLTGTGAGTYGDAMIKYQQTRVWVGSMSQWAHFNNAHSHYVQLAAEGGLLLVIPALTALIAVARLARRAIRDDRGEMQWARIGAAAGLIGIAVQSVWETSLVMPANAILCGAVAGLLLYHRARAGGRVEPSTDELERA